jgi:hypothetical protein
MHRLGRGTLTVEDRVTHAKWMRAVGGVYVAVVLLPVAVIARQCLVANPATETAVAVNARA